MKYKVLVLFSGTNSFSKAIKTKGTEIRTYKRKLGYIANISFGKYIAIPLGYNKGYTEQEAIEKAKKKVDEILEEVY